MPDQGARAGLLGFLPDLDLLGGGLLAAGFARGGVVGFEDHLLARAGNVNRDALAVEFPGGHVSAGHFFNRGGLGEVDGLGEGVIHESLQGCLGAHVLLGGDIRADHEDFLDVLGHLFHILAGTLLHGAVDDILAVEFAEAGFNERLLEHGAGVGELEVLPVVIDVADVSEGEDGFTAVAFTAGDGGDGAGGGDSGLGGVADAVALDAFGDVLPIEVGAVPVLLVLKGRYRRRPEKMVGVVNAAADGGERSALVRQLDAGLHGGVAHELHHLGAEVLTGGGAVTHAHVVHQVSQTHHAETDTAGAQGGFLELRDGGDVDIGVDDIIQEAGGEAGVLAQFLPIHGVVGSDVLGEVDGTEAAVLVGSEPLLTAGVGGFELVKVGDRVGAVGGIQEEEAGLTVVVRLLDDLLEEVAGAHGLVNSKGDALGFRLLEGAFEALGARVGEVGETQRPFAVFIDRGHEGIGDADGDIEIGDLVLVGLAGDELLHIRVVNAQDGHVGAAAGAALGDLTEGVVVNAQESHRTGGFTGGGFDETALGAQAGEGETVAAAGLLNEGSVAQGLEDAGGIAAHVVVNGQDKAGGELSEGSAGTGKGGGVGEESLAGEQGVVFARERGDISGPFFFHFGDVVGDAPEHFFHRFGGLAVISAAHVTLDQHLAGVVRQVNPGEILWHTCQVQQRLL